MHKALWRIACNCISVRKEGKVWVYDDPSVKAQPYEGDFPKRWA